MTFKAYGVERFARAIEMNVEQSRYLGQLVHNHPSLELLTPVTLNVVVFRYNPNKHSDRVSGDSARVPVPADRLNDLNTELLLRIQERGLAVPSSTMLRGAFCLRVCNVNHRTKFVDMDELVSDAVRVGDEIAREWFGGKSRSRSDEL